MSTVTSEQLALIRRGWLGAAAVVTPDLPGVPEFLESRLSDLQERGALVEPELLSVIEDAGQLVMTMGSPDLARDISKRLRRSVYEFLLARDASVAEEQPPACIPDTSDPPDIPGTGGAEQPVVMEGPSPAAEREVVDSDVGVTEDPHVEASSDEGDPDLDEERPAEWLRGIAQQSAEPAGDSVAGAGPGADADDELASSWLQRRARSGADGEISRRPGSSPSAWRHGVDGDDDEASEVLDPSLVAPRVGFHLTDPQDFPAPQGGTQPRDATGWDESDKPMVIGWEEADAETASERLSMMIGVEIDQRDDEPLGEEPAATAADSPAAEFSPNTHAPVVDAPPFVPALAVPPWGTNSDAEPRTAIPTAPEEDAAWKVRRPGYADGVASASGRVAAGIDDVGTSLDPTDADLTAERAEVDMLLKKKKFDQAGAILQQLAQDFGGRAVAELALDVGDHCRASGKRMAATSCYLAASRADPVFEEPLSRLADVCIDDKDTDLAVSYLERIARLTRLRGDLKGAVRIYRKIHVVAPYRDDILELLMRAQTTGRLDP